MRQQYVLGVDGGNTKTHYALFNHEGKLVDFLNAGTASHERHKHGYEGMLHELSKCINELLGRNGIHMMEVGFSVFGLAGADVKKQYDEISKRIEEIGLVNFKVCNDAFLGIKAGCANGYGICSINGTGTCCVGIDRHGNWIQIGGCGRMTGDDAGGGYLSTTAIKMVYEYIYKCGRPTIMKEMLFDLLEVADEAYFLDTVYEKVLTGISDRKLLVKIVFNAANCGDEPALELLEHVGRETSKAVVGAYKKLDFLEGETIQIVMAGSIYVKGENPTIINTFKKTVKENIHSDVRFQILNVPPVSGAVIWALEELNGNLDQATRYNVYRDLEQYM